MAKEYILKDRYGKDHTYNDETIYVRGTDGELMPFTQGTVEPLEITENGTYTAPDGVSYNPVNVNVDPTKVTLLREQRFDGFVLDATYGAYSPGYVSPAQFVLRNGETYYVKWDGTEYECVATAFNYSGMSMVFIGNGTYLGLPGNGEPFLITYNAGYDNTQLFSIDADSYHTVGIWQKAPGGSSDDVRYVTFMSHDGLIEYGKKAVAVGDDCANPIARGVFNTPTRESDAQYNYTFYGWATTPNGAADSAALKAVEEDRTVYANFASAVRYYTISYYDGDTLLTTRQVAYGGSDNYTPPAKDGYFFNAWNPKPENVTGDISCYAQYVMDVDFATASWQEIAAISESGEAETYFALGDKKALTFKSADGNTYTVNMEICGFNHDTLESGGKAGITLIADAIAGTSRKHSTDSRPSCNWDTCELRGKMSDILSSFPAELINLVKPVVKQYGYQTSSTHAGAIGTVVDKVWIPSAGELGLQKNSSYPYIIGDGSPYPSFDKKRGTTGQYWLRGGTTTSNTACAVYFANNLGYGRVENPIYAGIGVVIGFCI